MPPKGPKRQRDNPPKQDSSGLGTSQDFVELSQTMLSQSQNGLPDQLATTFKENVGKSPLLPFIRDVFLDVLWSRIGVYMLFRGVHVDDIPRLADRILDQGWLTTKTILVVESETDPNSYYLVDGVHRWMSVRYLVFNGKLPDTYMIPCCVLRKDTPNYMLVLEAAKQNAGNEHYVSMTWLDKVFWIKNVFFGLLQQHADKVLQAYVAKDITQVSAVDIHAFVNNIPKKSKKDGAAAAAEAEKKQGFSRTTIDKIFAVMKNCFSVVDAEEESRAAECGLDEGERRRTPWSWCMYLNNMTLAGKLELRERYRKAWTTFLKKANVASLRVHAVKAWIPIEGDAVKPWADKVILSSENTYDDGKATTALNAEWKAEAKGSTKRFDDRPMTEMFHRMLLGYYMLHGTAAKSSTDIMNIILTQATTPRKPTAVAELWVQLRAISEPGGLLNETQIFQARTKADANVAPGNAVIMPLLKQHALVSAEEPTATTEQDGTPLKKKFARNPKAPMLVETPLTRSAATTSQNSSQEQSADRKTDGGDSDAEHVYKAPGSQGERAFTGCSYATCAGRGAEDNALYECVDCRRKAKVAGAPNGQVCRCCITTRLLGPNIDREGDTIAACALCVTCWRAKKNTAEAIAEDAHRKGELEYKAIADKYLVNVKNDRVAKRAALEKLDKGTLIFVWEGEPRTCS